MGSLTNGRETADPSPTGCRVFNVVVSIVELGQINSENRGNQPVLAGRPPSAHLMVSMVVQLCSLTICNPVKSVTDCLGTSLEVHPNLAYLHG
jgi:hypothetical protein